MCVYVSLNYNLLTTMAVRLSLYLQVVMLTMFPFYKKDKKSTVQFHLRQEEDFQVNSFLYLKCIQLTSLHRNKILMFARALNLK